MSTLLGSDGCAWAETGQICADQRPLCARGQFGQLRVQSPSLLKTIPMYWFIRPIPVCRVEDAMLD